MRRRRRHLYFGALVLCGCLRLSSYTQTEQYKCIYMEKEDTIGNRCERHILLQREEVSIQSWSVSLWRKGMNLLSSKPSAVLQEEGLNIQRRGDVCSSLERGTAYTEDKRSGTLLLRNGQHGESDCPALLFIFEETNHIQELVVMLFSLF